ncbi:ABC transporter ATP-binding protein [Undibacterium squillarum]|uniref:ABC transporter ATP-binding protein n=1 Tax=Undibacterium squillarum TaxID=1131567 RepID=A0ABQ2XY41_9BURK|nr:ABC transporter ATP-binding protein [Undibacterium squillarum]GGX41920.1 ABC transporter ATP-binding protein [Undibacterium squillarum]
MSLLQVQHLRHAYQDRTTLHDLSFELQQGEIACLLGPSGCGKTTALRCIAGFEAVQDGQILLNGKLVSRQGMTLPPQHRKIGMVFQDYALFPHLTVAANVRLGLHQTDRQSAVRRVSEMLEITGLQHYAGAYPHELSGGQQQRVALARALAPSPDLILMDEPFSNLDTELRVKLSAEVRSLLKAQGSTAIIVTHDQHEAFALADQIGLLQHGIMQQWGAAYDLYHRPRNPFVANFIGEGVLLPALACEQDCVHPAFGELRGSLSEQFQKDEAVNVLIRPDDIVHDDSSPIQARVISKAFRGAEFLYTLELQDGTRVLSLVPSHHDHALGEAIGIRIEVDHLIAFRA